MELGSEIKLVVVKSTYKIKNIENLKKIVKSNRNKFELDFQKSLIQREWNGDG